MALFVTCVGALGIANVVLGATNARYRREVQRLRSSMTETERRRVDLVVASEEHRVRVALELVRRQARGDHELHLAVEVDSGRMVLERDGVALREMAVEVGPARRVGAPPDTIRLVPPRGARTVARLVRTDEEWEVPRWVYEDRGLPPPDERATRGALGILGIVLSGGTFVYALPNSGPLADGAYVLPGAIRVSAEDLRAIAPNIAPGMSVYFY
jgi:hypothetical protein